MSAQYSCMIVDDEQDAVMYLSALLRENCPSLHLLATANSSSDAILQYYKHRPDLVFMDIEVDRMNGFDILNEICGEKCATHFVFVTGYDRYAVEAFKTNALGYLLKPVAPEDLIRVVDRFLQTRETEFQQEKFWQFVRDYSGKVRFNTSTGFELVNPGEILWCEADHNYTRIYVDPEKPLLVSLNLAAVEEKLPGGGFQRISRSILINDRYLASVHRRNKTCTLHFNGREIVLQASAEMIRKL
ncbi:MAG: response regulator transcription factor [Prolixibacteraceae bacterium]|nr:response regulator transcription factor [Prolixibacteraceae bacterium]NLX28293.1 response regulator transcription factor [Bacteroidales bacterium]HPJ80009.1 LytTR family DNA-binding domain-containing protein [Prolixibacteraceae bacterium]HRV90215.1 LytTR family DNA-binding domain-containing protein [Prolixibacteraceae bacterium]